MARRNRKITLSQLGAIIGESELTLKMIEQGSLPDDSNRIISKLAQFFKINLRKSEAMKEQNRIEQATRVVREPARVLNFDSKSLNNLTISDLKRMKDEREEADRELASKVAWKGGKEKDKEREESESVIGKDVEIIDDDSESISA